VEIAFSNRRMQKTMESQRELVRTYGDRLGKLIGRRLLELRALPNLEAGMRVPQLGLHQLGADRDEQFAVTLVQPRRLVFEVGNEPIPRLADGGIAVAEVTAIVIREVVDYH
jgi:plasmid maintenance system killer protein